MEKDDILSLLHSVVHPETGSDIVSAGIVQDLLVSDDKIEFLLDFPRRRDPLAASIKRQAERAVAEKYPEYTGKLIVHLKENTPQSPAAAPKTKNKLTGITNIIAVSSAKGGVGKSTVTANLALALAGGGYRTGILDADIYGPSQPMLFGLEDFVLEGGKAVDGTDIIFPAVADGIEIMSIGFFIDPRDALVWRGPMATNALRQMIHQTEWGELDYLLVDLPPGTGDIHLSIISEMEVTGAVIVSTPQELALADVVRGINMFRGEHVGIPVLGIVENMAWFTPAEHPGERYYIFGRGGVRKLAEQEGLPLLAEIPLILAGDSSNGPSDGPAKTVNRKNEVVNKIYKTLARDISVRIGSVKKNVIRC